MEVENLIPSTQLQELIAESKRYGVERLVVGIFIERQGSVDSLEDRKILFLKRAATENFLPNVEEIPGGGVEPNESVTDTVIRETWEETGLKVTKILRYCSQFDYKNRKGRLTRQFNFLVEVNEGGLVQDSDIKLNPTEHTSFRWVGKSDLEDFLGTDEMKQVILKYFEE